MRMPLRPYLSLLIFCPVESWMDVEDLQEVVKEVNQTIVSEVDYLSDKVYMFCYETSLISVV